MEFLGDFHLHSRFSRATSRDLSLPYLHGWAQRKGIAVVGTGDFTHPGWMAEMHELLVPAGEGVYRLRDEQLAEAERDVPPGSRVPVRFVLTGEISSIYKQDGKTRKVHSVVFAPDMETAERINARLMQVGNLGSDGRPILGISARNLLEIVLEAGHGAFVVPAHIWTPWFSLLGSRSGFDSVDACYGDLTQHIFAVETGLSADPPMCRRLSILDGLTLISNSDAHSGIKLGREANRFDTDLDFPSIRTAWEDPDSGGFLGTIEFFPEEGKYHFDGHRKCGVRFDPEETRAHEGLCPVCGKPVTLGVLSRVEELADREVEAGDARRDTYEMLVPLGEVLGEVMEVGSGSKRVQTLFHSMLSRLGPELEILRTVPPADIERASTSLVAEAIRRVRERELFIEAGYDGEFGTVRIFSPGERSRLAGQGTLFAMPDAVLTREGGGAARPGAARAPDPSLPDEPADPFGSGLRPPATPTDHVGLNEAQRSAVEAPAGPVLILAGPGTGKTRTLTHRIVHRIQQGEVSPDAVLAVTFTNRAAEEMRERLRRLLPDASVCRRLTVVTLHALGLMILRADPAGADLEPGFRVLDEEQREELIAASLPAGSSARDRKAARAILDAEATLSTSQPAAPDGDFRLRRRYEALKKSQNVVDFDDLIQRPLRMFVERPDTVLPWQQRFRFVAVDEYQDLNPAQYALLRQLLPRDNDLTAIGDPDQAIYGFRGASPSFFLQFERDFPGAEVIRMTRSYRSTESIISAASQVIARSPVRWETRLWSGLAGPERITIRSAPTPRAEAEAVVADIERFMGGVSEFSMASGRVPEAAAGRGYGFADLAILYRMNALRGPLEEALDRAGLPYQVAGHDAILSEAEWTKAVSILRNLPRRPGVRVAEVVAETIPERRLAEGLAAFARPFGDDLDAFLDQIVLGRGVDLHDPAAERISLLTLHASKGLEFPVVFIVGCEESVLPFPGVSSGRDADGPGEPETMDLEEERRLFYVGMTRARTWLVLSHAQKRTLFGRKTPGKPSPFLADIAERLKAVPATRRLRRRRGQPEQNTLF